MVKKVQNIIEICQKSLLSMILLLVPLFFNFVYITNNIYDVNKIIVFKELMIFSLIFVCLGLVFSDKMPVFRRKEMYLPGLWLIFIILATLASRNISLSFFGSYERDQGFITQIFYLIFFLLLLTTIDAKKIDKYIFIAVIASFLASVYALMQASGYDFIAIGNIADRSSSTIGQPNFLGQFLLLTICLPVYLFYKTKNIYSKLFYVIVILVGFSAIFFTYSRASWAGLLFGLIAIGVLFLFLEKPWNFLKKNLIKIILVGILLLILCFILIFKNQNFSYRMQNAFDYKKSSLAVRFTFWNNSIDIVKKRPLFGYGLDDYASEFSDHYKKDWAILGYVNQYPDRAHNIIFDTLLAGGFVGLAIVLFFYVSLFSIIIKNIRNGRNKLLNYICLISLFSYSVSLLFSFQSITDGVYFWFILSLAIIGGRKDAEDRVDSIDLNKVNNALKYAIKIMFCIFILSLLWLARIEFKKLLADFYLNEFRVASGEGDINASIKMYDLIKWNSYYRQPAYDNFMVYYYTAMLYENIDANSKDKIIGILKNMDLSAQGNSYENEKKIFLVYSALAVYPERNAEYEMKAESALEELVAAKSDMPAVYRLGARYYCSLGKLERSADYSKKALSFLPELDKVETNLDHENNIKAAYYFIYRELGDCYLKNRKFKEAGENYLSAYNNFLDDTNLLKNIADTYVYRQEYARAIDYLKLGEKRNPADYVWPYAIAQVYAMQNDKNNAVKYAEKSMLLSADKREIKDFIDQIK